MSNKIAAKESLKIINDELKKQLNLIPIEKQSRSKIQSFCIGSKNGKQFLLVMGKNNDAKQTRIITEKTSSLPSIKDVEPTSDLYEGASIKRLETSLGFKNHFRNGNQNSFIINNSGALKEFIRWYAKNIVATESDPNDITLTKVSEHLSEDVTLNKNQAIDILNLTNNEIESTTREQLIQARLGQSIFRQNVINVWGVGECCFLTGIEIKQLLIASHIIPWRESDDNERIKGTNGILLCSHFDKLFDHYLISFNTSGQIQFSERLSDIELKSLKKIGIDNSMRLNSTKLSTENHNAVFYNLKAHHEKMIELDHKLNFTI